MGTLFTPQSMATGIPFGRAPRTPPITPTRVKQTMNRINTPPSRPASIHPSETVSPAKKKGSKDASSTRIASPTRKSKTTTGPQQTRTLDPNDADESSSSDDESDDEPVPTTATATTTLHIQELTESDPLFSTSDTTAQHPEEVEEAYTTSSSASDSDSADPSNIPHTPRTPRAPTSPSHSHRNSDSEDDSKDDSNSDSDSTSASLRLSKRLSLLHCGSSTTEPRFEAQRARHRVRSRKEAKEKLGTGAKRPHIATLGSSAAGTTGRKEKGSEVDAGMIAFVSQEVGSNGQSLWVGKVEVEEQEEEEEEEEQPDSDAMPDHDLKLSARRMRRRTKGPMDMPDIGNIVFDEMAKSSHEAGK